jgi:TolB-like protein/DNA-binding winged helix-turn-helix (wHTH) protein
MNAESLPIALATASAFQVDDLIIEVRMRRVTRGGMSLDIADRSFDVLLALLRAAPNLMSTQELMDCVWAGVIVGPETITQRIKLLRQSLSDSAEKPRYIAVLRGRGYRIVAQVIPLAALPQPGAVVTSPSTPGVAIDGEPAAPAGSAQGRRRWIPGILVLTLLLVAGGTWLGLERRSDGQLAGREAPRAEPAPVPRSSIAVLPFANLTGAPAMDYLGDGMAEELINALAQVPGLKVPARTSAFAYKGHNVDIRRIAQELGVATILEGSVRSTGERLRVSARLVDAVSGYQIWSQDYDRESADIFEVQDDLAGQIVQALRAYVKVDLKTPPGRMPPSTNVHAYELYLQARSIARGTGPSEHQAAVLLDQALSLDPDFAEALGDRAIIGAASVALAGAPTQLLEGAQRDATRALASDSTSSDANTAQELVYAVHGEWVKAEASFRAGMASGDTDPIMRSFHAMILLRPLGRLQQAQAELTETYRMAPNDGFTVHELAMTDSLLGLDGEALRLGGISEEISGLGGPPHTDLFLVQARAAARAGRYREAAERATLALPEPLRQGAGGQAIQAFYAALADPARRPAALKAVQAFIPTLKSGVFEGRTRMFFIDALAMIGAHDAAYELAMWCVNQRALKPGSIDWSDVWMPEMRPFRSDPRFQVFVQQLRLPDYWRAYGPPDACDVRDGTLWCQ